MKSLAAEQSVSERTRLVHDYLIISRFRSENMISHWNLEGTSLIVDSFHIAMRLPYSKLKECTGHRLDAGPGLELKIAYHWPVIEAGFYRFGR